MGGLFSFPESTIGEDRCGFTELFHAEPISSQGCLSREGVTLASVEPEELCFVDT